MNTQRQVGGTMERQGVQTHVRRRKKNERPTLKGN